VEYDDGGYEGGVSTARSDAEVITHFTERGSVSRVELALGRDATFTLEQAGSTDWPLHTCGTVSSSSAAAGRTIARSWNYTEFFPLNWGAVADYQAGHAALYGRYPSFARLMKNARIKDQLLTFDEL
jgi:hypothetical protein